MFIFGKKACKIEVISSGHTDKTVFFDYNESRGQFLDLLSCSSQLFCFHGGCYI